MFFSRRALQRDDKQAVKLFHVGGHFFKNNISQQLWDREKFEGSQQSLSDIEGSKNTTNNDNEKDEIFAGNNEELSLDYLPNELRYTQQYYNKEADIILNGPDNLNKNMLVEFFRGITLCHQLNVTKNVKLSEGDMY